MVFIVGSVVRVLVSFRLQKTSIFILEYSNHGFLSKETCNLSAI